MRFTFGFLDNLLFIRLGCGDALFGFAFRTRDDVVFIRRRFVHRTLLVLLRRVDVIERFNNFFRRIGILHFRFRNQHACAIPIKNILQKFLRLGVHLLATRRIRLFQRRLADHFTQRAFGCNLDRTVRVADVEKILSGVFDLPLHDEVNVDDVLVTRQHQTFRAGITTEADLGGIHTRHVGSRHRAKR